MSASSISSPPKEKRTNSLGRASDDCFACQKRRRNKPDSSKSCDRQRPRCNVCNELGVVCSGYLQTYQWQGGAARASWSYSNSIQKSADETISDRRRPSIANHHEHKFTFIKESVEHEYVDTSFQNKKRKRERSCSPGCPKMSRTTRQRSAPPAQTDTTVRVNPYTGKVDGNFRFVWAHGIPIPMIKPNAGMGWSGDSEQAPGDDSDSPKLPLNPDSRKAFVGARQPELTRHLHDYSSRSLLDALAQRIKPWLDPKGDGEIAVEADIHLKPLDRPSWHQVVGTLTARSARSTATTPMLRSLTSTELSPALTGRSLESRVVENKLEVGPEPGGSLYSITYYEEVVCPILQPDHKANLRNPFREVLQFLPECPSLQHMIEAVSALHRGEANSSQELYNLGLKQLELECEGLEQSTDASARDIATTNGLLATIFAMFTHKFFTGGGSYVHEIFRYVCRIVEFQGGSQALSLNTQMQPHMACMLYTDLAVSMLARRKSIFPTDYLDVIVKAQNETWSFYHLVGLTTKVVICMSQICALSTLDSESEAYRAHNQTLQRNIRQIVPDDNAGSYDAIGESTKLQQLRITWQNALRIHYHQVYCPEEMNTECMREMAAQIIDYITSLAQSPVRSYFRLPLLLAGSEERGLRRRSHLIEVIQGWARSTGIKSWLNSVQVLECLWSRQQAADGRDWSLYDLLEVDGWLE